tara:strand:- start:7943 stop:8089 length:147 start_codon:yes stop_codon:yes gene_type:complete
MVKATPHDASAPLLRLIYKELKLIRKLMEKKEDDVAATMLWQRGMTKE